MELRLRLHPNVVVSHTLTWHPNSQTRSLEQSSSTVSTSTLFRISSGVTTIFMIFSLQDCYMFRFILPRWHQVFRSHPLISLKRILSVLWSEKKKEINLAFTCLRKLENLVKIFLVICFCSSPSSNHENMFWCFLPVCFGTVPRSPHSTLPSQSH